jgi:hypothetical protein
MEKLELKLKAKHFKENIYEDIFDCACVRSAKEIFTDAKRITSGSDRITVDAYDHYYYPTYDYNMFKEDQEKAGKLNYFNDIIRILPLTKLI